MHSMECNYQPKPLLCRGHVHRDGRQSCWAAKVIHVLAAQVVVSYSAVSSLLARASANSLRSLSTSGEKPPKVEKRSACTSTPTQPQGAVIHTAV